ncbi:MAG: uracil-DNA glycosylase [Candidatus Marinimicrobia bacterium]|nr:uracil-DNA glycosylase [Candidatus Neomarinimicrobiota bacterium]MCF7839170.1 uracil-DNA glycosylase [Candidatus Neomarinimicrobiota bacterium]
MELFGSPLYRPDPNQDSSASVTSQSQHAEMAFASDFTTFQHDIENCQKCPLGKSRTHFVFGVGNPNADLMLVGEAPGRDEDLQGIPFVGRAGQLLDKILVAINLSRDEVFIANVLKCRPPNNRDPLPEEVEQCEPYLRHQIALIKPKLIVALGRVAAKTLLRMEDTLKNMRQKAFTYEGVDLRVTYHPAALLRNSGFKPAAWEDFQQIRDLYQAKRKDAEVNG